MIRYWKKFQPQVKLQLSNGLNLQFINVDGQWGVLMVGNAEIQKELEVCIRNEIGGVSEISEAEYTELFQKKTMSPRPWREEFGKNNPPPRPPPTSQPIAEQSVAGKSEPERFPDTVVHQQPIVAQPAPAFRPTAIPRKD